MDWEKLKDEIYNCDGSWRDIYVKETTSEDWNSWVTMVNERYRINWHNGKTNKDESKIDFKIIQEYWEGNHDLCSTANIFINDIQINAHFFSDSEIENDIDPREFKTIEDHNRLIEYLKLVSIVCGKEVIVTPENYPEIVLIKVYKKEVKIFLK